MSRGQNSFWPVTPQGSICTLRHVGDSDPPFKIHRMKSLSYSGGLFTRFLKIWASDLVGAIITS